MAKKHVGLLQFQEIYLGRIWGGRRLETLFEKSIPAGKSIGEAWLVSDHPSHESVVSNGPHAGKTLHQLLKTNPGAILGDRPSLTPHGRFPLLLKILDAHEPLSVQVHPDDECAKRLQEPDVGKTEMWYVLHADPGSELICGLDPHMTRDGFRKAVSGDTLGKSLKRITVNKTTAVLLTAGTVHAIGKGIALAEIQQNSDLTYRIYDWGRVQENGRPRELHVDKALEAIQFGSRFPGPANPLTYFDDGVHRSVLAACRHFAAELVTIEERSVRRSLGQTFHIVLTCTGNLTFDDGFSPVVLPPGQAALLPASLGGYIVQGTGSYLDYYVPDLERDIIQPLLAEGFPRACITALGGSPSASDLAEV